MLTNNSNFNCQNQIIIKNQICMKNKKLTKAVLYDALSEQGLLLPKIKSSICNMEYLIRVKNCIEYCPKVHEVPDLICLQPPKKMLLLDFIQYELQKRGDHRIITFDEKHMPDVDWCLHAVSALNPQHQIFNPDYLPEKSERGRRGVRYIPKAEDFIFQEPVQVSRSFSKMHFNGASYTQETNKGQAQCGSQNARNVTFQQYGEKVIADHLFAAEQPNAGKSVRPNHINPYYDSINQCSRQNVQEYQAPQNINHFDLSLDESAPYVYIQSNAYSKKKIAPQNYEEEKIHDEEIVSVRKLKKSQTEQKAHKQQQAAPSKQDQVSSEKIGGLFQMLQNLDNRGLLPQEMQPYLDYYCQNHVKQEGFAVLPSVMHAQGSSNKAHQIPSFEPASTFILPMQHDERVFPNESKRSQKKKSLHFQSKRSASVHTSASSETRFLDFQGEQCIAHEQTQFCESYEPKPVRKSFNRLDIVMKDESKLRTKPELIQAQLNQTQSEVLADQNLSQLIEPAKTQIQIGIKAEVVEDEIVFEESSQRYADRKISQQFNCDAVAAQTML